MSDEEKLSKFSPNRSIIERNKRNISCMKTPPGKNKPLQGPVYQNCLSSSNQHPITHHQLPMMSVQALICQPNKDQRPTTTHVNERPQKHQLDVSVHTGKAMQGMSPKQQSSDKFVNQTVKSSLRKHEKGKKMHIKENYVLDTTDPKDVDLQETMHHESQKADTHPDLLSKSRSSVCGDEQTETARVVEEIDYTRALRSSEEDLIHNLEAAVDGAAVIDTEKTMCFRQSQKSTISPRKQNKINNDLPLNLVLNDPKNMSVFSQSFLAVQTSPGYRPQVHKWGEDNTSGGTLLKTEKNTSPSPEKPQKSMYPPSIARKTQKLEVIERIMDENANVTRPFSQQANTGLHEGKPRGSYVSCGGGVIPQQYYYLSQKLEERDSSPSEKSAPRPKSRGSNSPSPVIVSLNRQSVQQVHDKHIVINEPMTPLSSAQHDYSEFNLMRPSLLHHKEKNYQTEKSGGPPSIKEKKKSLGKSKKSNQVGSSPKQQQPKKLPEDQPQSKKSLAAQSSHHINSQDITNLGQNYGQKVPQTSSTPANKQKYSAALRYYQNTAGQFTNAQPVAHRKFGVRAAGVSPTQNLSKSNDKLQLNIEQIILRKNTTNNQPQYRKKYPDKTPTSKIEHESQVVVKMTEMTESLEHRHHKKRRINSSQSGQQSRAKSHLSTANFDDYSGDDQEIGFENPEPYSQEMSGKDSIVQLKGKNLWKSSNESGALAIKTRQYIYSNEEKISSYSLHDRVVMLSDSNRKQNDKKDRGAKEDEGTRLTDIVIEQKLMVTPIDLRPMKRQILSAANTNHQEYDENDEDQVSVSPRQMRKAMTREGLVDIPNLLAEKGRKPVVLNSNEQRASRNQHARHYMSDMSMNRKMLIIAKNKKANLQLNDKSEVDLNEKPVMYAVGPAASKENSKNATLVDTLKEAHSPIQTSYLASQWQNSEERRMKIHTQSEEEIKELRRQILQEQSNSHNNKVSTIEQPASTARSVGIDILQPLQPRISGGIKECQVESSQQTAYTWQKTKEMKSPELSRPPVLRIEVAKNADIQDSINNCQQQFEIGVGTQDLDELKGAEEAFQLHSSTPGSSHHFGSVALQPKQQSNDRDPKSSQFNPLKTHFALQAAEQKFLPIDGTISTLDEPEGNFMRFMRQGSSQYQKRSALRKSTQAAKKNQPVFELTYSGVNKMPLETKASAEEQYLNRTQQKRLLPKVSDLSQELNYLNPEQFAAKAQRWSHYPRIIVKNPDGSDSILFVDSDGLSKDNAMVQKIITETMQLTGTSIGQAKHYISTSNGVVMETSQNSPQSKRQESIPELISQASGSMSTSAVIFNNINEMSSSVKEFMNYTANQFEGKDSKNIAVNFHESAADILRKSVMQQDMNANSVTCTYTASILNHSEKTTEGEGTNIRIAQGTITPPLPKQIIAVTTGEMAIDDGSLGQTQRVDHDLKLSGDLHSHAEDAKTMIMSTGSGERSIPPYLVPRNQPAEAHSNEPPQVIQIEISKQHSPVGWPTSKMPQLGSFTIGNKHKIIQQLNITSEESPRGDEMRDRRTMNKRVLISQVQDHCLPAQNHLDYDRAMKSRMPPATAQFFQSKKERGTERPIRSTRNDDLYWNRFLEPSCVSDPPNVKKREYQPKESVITKMSSVKQSNDKTKTSIQESAGLFAKISSEFSQAQLSKREKFKYQLWEAKNLPAQAKPLRRVVQVRDQRVTDKMYRADLLSSLSSKNLSTERGLPLTATSALQNTRVRSSMGSDQDVSNYFNNTGSVLKTNRQQPFRRLQWQNTSAQDPVNRQTSPQQLSPKQNSNMMVGESTLLKESDLADTSSHKQSPPLNLKRMTPDNANAFFHNLNNQKILGCRLGRKRRDTQKSKGKHSAGKDSDTMHTKTPGNSSLDQYMENRFDHDGKRRTPTPQTAPHRMRKKVGQPSQGKLLSNIDTEEAAKIGTINMEKTIDQDVSPHPVTAVQVQPTPDHDRIRTRNSSVMLANAELELKSQMAAAAQYFQQEAEKNNQLRKQNNKDQGASDSLMHRKFQLQKRARSQAQMQRLQTEARLENFVPTQIGRGLQHLPVATVLQLQQQIVKPTETNYVPRPPPMTNIYNKPAVERQRHSFIGSNSNPIERKQSQGSSLLQKTQHYRLKRGPAKLISSDYRKNGIRMMI